MSTDQATSYIFTQHQVAKNRNDTKHNILQESVPVFLVSEEVKEKEVKRGAVTSPRYNWKFIAKIIPHSFFSLERINQWQSKVN